MASKTTTRRKPVIREKLFEKSLLKKGDMIMVISGGHSKKRPIKGQVGKILRFVGDDGDRVIIEGINMVTKHRRQTAPDKPAGKVMIENSMHLSNVMFYVEKLKKPVRLKSNFLSDGKKVRGYLDPKNKQFVQV